MGLGIAVQAVEGLLLAAEVNWVDWSKSILRSAHAGESILRSSTRLKTR